DTFVCTQQYLENQKKLYPDEPLIQAATFMMLDEDNITRQTVNTQLKEHHVELSHILEVTTMDLLIQFAEIGLGIACVIRDFVKKELEEGTLVEVPVGFSFPLREIGFVCRQKDADSALIAPFFDDETEHPDKSRNVKKFPSDHCDQMGILNFKKVSYHCITCVTSLTQTSLRFVRVAQNLLHLQ
ncbi:MAG: substrate-binding domain-containing protein, partial [Blautia faecis]|nr:substrate-binding domain-containing protein [Blautia faecis]